MTNAHTPTEKSKKHRDNIKNATKNFDYTTIADLLRTSVGVTAVTPLVWLKGLFYIKAMYLSDKLSLMCPRLWPIEDVCIGLYVLKRLLNVWHILEKVMSMQHRFEEFSEKQRRVELKSVGNFVAKIVLV